MCNFTFRFNDTGIEKDRHSKQRKANQVHRIDRTSLGISILSKFFSIFVIFSLDVARFVLPSRLECSINIPPPFGLRRTSWALPSLPAQILCKGHRFTHRLDRRAWPTPDLLATRNFRFQRRWEKGEEGETLLWFLRDLIEPPKETCSSLSFTAKFYAQVPLLVFSYFPNFSNLETFFRMILETWETFKE